MENHWNYRIMRHTPLNKYDSVHYAIHSVHYVNGAVDRWSKEPAFAPFGETLEDVRKTTEQMWEAFSKPVLDYATGKEI